jgi:hypothetical protein
VSLMNDSDGGATQVGWLSRARAQSQQLAEQRAQVVRPFVGVKARPARPWLATHPLLWRAAAIALLLLVTSGAWALVRIGGRRSPSPTMAPPPAERSAPTSAPAPRVVAVPAATETRPARKVRPAVRAAPAPAPTAGPSSTYQEPDGDLILVLPPRHGQPPLFSPGDWKHRRSPE